MHHNAEPSNSLHEIKGSASSNLLQSSSLCIFEEEESANYIGEPKLIAIIGDEDTCVGFVIAGIGELDKHNTPNYYVVDEKTDHFELELAFLDILERSDIGLVLITREAADKIPTIINRHCGLEPTVMVIPGHNGPYEFEMPLAVKYIEEKKMASHSTLRGSVTSASNASLKTIDSLGGSLGKKVSTHSIRSSLSCKSLKM
ncbi:unnamed protein product [Ceutorhynchus assimilis]|uniref:V-type proton ATPase subunit F n=1 Tax=Ceutorhynchus assimilis TaxID=467358 RepID=A0A9N9MR86_9CUCU|nr:unnamed protein product [Ceutorhynchus assimilis]